MGSPWSTLRLDEDAVGRGRGGAREGGLTGMARTTDDAFWAVHTWRLKEELHGVLTTEADIGSSIRQWTGADASSQSW
jgi:hypothetical protein